MRISGRTEARRDAGKRNEQTRAASELGRPAADLAKRRYTIALAQQAHSKAVAWAAAVAFEVEQRGEPDSSKCAALTIAATTSSGTRMRDIC